MRYDIYIYMSLGFKRLKEGKKGRDDEAGELSNYWMT